MDPNSKKLLKVRLLLKNLRQKAKGKTQCFFLNTLWL